MGLCDAPLVVLAQFGDLAITIRSLLPIAAVCLWMSVCTWLCMRRGLLSSADLVLPGLSLLYAAGMVFAPASVRSHILEKGLPGWVILLPLEAFLLGYGIWRVAGRKPLQNWPWYRFGLAAAICTIVVDVSAGLLLPPGNGHLWQLGGACVKDALYLGPLILTAIYSQLLECGRPLTFCSKACRDSNRCLHPPSTAKLQLPH